MPYLPDVTPIAETPIFTNTFGGYNHHDVVSEGETYDEINMSAAEYPSLVSAKNWKMIPAYYKTDGTAEYTFTNPLGMLAKASLITIDGPNVYISGHIVDNISVSTDEGMLPKQIISMGAYICIFPDGIYINSIQLTDCGYMGAEWNQDGYLTAALCTAEGDAYDASQYWISSTPPADPEPGALWVDTSASPHVLKTWNALTAEWVGMASTYVRIESPGIGQQFNRDDAVFISGITCPEEYIGTELELQVQALNECMTIYAKGDNYLVVAGILDRTITMEEGAVAVERRIPRLDYVVESNNRIWGCIYGLVDGQTLNEIHCCAQGDFRNWYQYAGLSTDSYTVSCGTDGPFTGAGVLKGSPVFFKESCLHRVTGTMPRNYQVQTTMCRGVQDGSWRSVQVVGENLIYKGRTDVMMYDGSLPVPISAKLGDVKYTDAVGGAIGDVYYIAMRSENNENCLFTYDAGKNIWHRLLNFKALCMAALGDTIYAMEGGYVKRLIALNGTGDGNEMTDYRWSATFGEYGYDAEHQKYLSRFVVRMYIGPVTPVRYPAVAPYVDAQVRYDGGDWESVGRFTGQVEGTGSINIPFIPRRCDHMQLKLSGNAPIKIYSIARTYRGGSRYSGSYFS